ncbi:MAG: TRAP transporter large permease [Hyphomicrobiaceae bacterium]
MLTIGILAGLLGLLAIRIPVAFALGGLGMILLLAAGFSPLMVPQALQSSTQSFVLLSVPMFLMMSNILLKGGVGADLYAAVQSWVGHWPGGLAIATIISCALFAAISGSSVACAATIGTVAIPEMVRRGYPPSFVYGLLAAGGTLGILIPPSIPMIVYGFITEESITALFIAGIGPGLLLCSLFAGYSVIYALTHPEIPRAEPAPRAERWSATLRALPALSIAVFIFASIYSGAATPTEAAAIGFAFSVVVTTVILRTMTWQKFLDAVREAAVTTVAILLIVAAAKVFGKAIALYRIPQDVSAFIIATFVDPGSFVAFVSVVLLVMGCFLEAISMMLLMVPVLAPTLGALGIDTIWFGIFFVLMIECALITPPVGLNLYVIQSIAKASLTEVVKGAWAFVALMLLAVVLVYLFPEIVLFLVR